MQVLITGKHLEITDLMKQHIEESFSGIFADKTLKVSTIRVIIEFEKTRSNFHVSANVSMKNRDVTTQVDNHDMYKAVADAVEKIRSQVENTWTRYRITATNRCAILNRSRILKPDRD